MFRDCSWSRKFWSLAPVGICKKAALDVRDWLTAVLKDGKFPDAELLADLLWQISFTRNELCFEKLYSSLEVCIKRARDGLMEYQRWNGSARRHKISRDHVKWCSPSSNYIKVNFDAALMHRQNWYGMGVVARDSSGMVLLAAAKMHRHLFPAEMAEISAVDWAISLVLQQHWDSVILEGDAALVIEALKK